MSADRRPEPGTPAHESDPREGRSSFLPPLPDFKNPDEVEAFFFGEGDQPGRLARMGELKRKLDVGTLTDDDRTEALALVAQLRHAILSCPREIQLPFETNISRESVFKSIVEDTRRLRILCLEETEMETDFTADGEKIVELKLMQDGQELRRIGEKSSNRIVFASADGTQVIKVSDIPAVAWQELIAKDDVPEELLHLLAIPIRHGRFKAGQRTYYFEVMEKLDTRGIVNRDVEALAIQLEPYLGSGEMKYAGQWGRRPDGRLAIFDYLNWRNADLQRSTVREPIPEATLVIPQAVRDLYRKAAGYQFSDILIQRDVELEGEGGALPMLTGTIDRRYPPNSAAAAKALFQEASAALQSGDWRQMEKVLDKLDPAWRGGDIYYQTAAEVKKFADFGVIVGPQEMERVMRETVLPILNPRGLDPENESVQFDVKFWNVTFGEKKPHEIVAEARRLLEEANKQ